MKIFRRKKAANTHPIANNKSTSAPIANRQPAQNDELRGCAPKQVFWVLVVLAIGALALITMKLLEDEKKPTEPQERSWRANLQKVNLIDARPTVQIFGTVEAPDLTTVRAAYAADVATTSVAVGTRFKKGDVLATLAGAELQLVLSQRKSDVDLLKVRQQSNKLALAEEKRLLKLSNDELNRQNRLASRGAVSGSQLEQTRSAVLRQQLAVAQRQLAVDEFPARLAQAQAALDKAKLDTDRAIITAPFDGIVATLDVAPGDRLQPGQPILSYYDPNEMEIRAPIPDKQLSSLPTNRLPLAAVGYSPNASYPLTLIRLSGKTSDNSGSINGYFALRDRLNQDQLNQGQLNQGQLNQDQTNSSNKLVPGQILTIQLQLPVEKNVASIPASALYELERVYIAEPKKVTELDIENYKEKLLTNCLEKIIFSAEESQTVSELREDCTKSAEEKIEKEQTNSKKDLHKNQYRLKRIDVEVVGQWQPKTANKTNTNKPPETELLVRSSELKNGMPLVTTQLPNAISGLLITDIKATPGLFLQAPEQQDPKQ